MADTDTQHLEKLRTYWKQHHAFPSMAKLCDVVGMASTASVFDMVSRLKDWAVFEVPLHGSDQPWTRHLAGWSCEDHQGQVCSAVQQFDPQTSSCLTESGRVYRLTGRPGLNADAEYVRNRWKRIAALTEQREVTKEVADALSAAKKGVGDGLAT